MSGCDVLREQASGTHGLAPASADRSSGNGGTYTHGTGDRPLVNMMRLDGQTAGLDQLNSAAGAITPGLRDWTPFKRERRRYGAATELKSG
jgi:hypothetical protein